MKKRVLLTVNPRITEQRCVTTMRGFITGMDKCFDLLVLPVSGYDFKRGRVRAFRRLKGGAFEDVGMIKPAGDLWIVYSDGFYLNHRSFGFRLRRDYFNAQIDFHQKHLSAGSVRLMVNNPEAETRTQKSWLATLNFKKMKVIPTYVFQRIDEVYDFQKKHRAIVVKPVWGGAATGVRRLADEASVRKFDDELKKHSDRDLSDYCFQPIRWGDEKRLWFVGGKFVAGRKFRGRGVPWDGWDDECPLSRYNKNSHKGFAEDLIAARRLCELSGISMGSIDFIGDRINEINGGGTVMTTYARRKIFIDNRPAIVEYLMGLAQSL